MKNNKQNNKLNRKGQGALEYLMTYGWAILILSIALVVLWQLGVFSLTSSVSSGYSGFGEVNPAGFLYKSDGNFECVLTNDARGSVTINKILVQAYNSECGNNSVSTNLDAGKSEKFNISNCPTGFSGDSYQVTLVVYFTDTSTEPNVNHTSAGKLWGSYDA